MRLIVLFVLLLALQVGGATENDCDYKIELILNQSEFTSENFEWSMKATKITGVASNITGSAEIKEGARLIKDYNPWKNEKISRQKTSAKYSPNLKEGIYTLTAEINLTCNDMSLQNNRDSEDFNVIAGLMEKADEESIESKPKEEEKENNAAKINEDVKLKQEAISDEILHNISDNKNTKNNTSINNTLNKTKVYQNIIYSQESKSLEFEGSKATGNVAKSSLVIYESSKEKTKNKVVLFLLVLSITINIILIWRR